MTVPCECPTFRTRKCVRQSGQKAQLIHNQAVQSVETEAIIGDELWSFVKKNRNSVYRKS